MITVTAAVLALATTLLAADTPQWIWHAEPSAPPGAVRYFRKSFDLRHTDRARLEITADNAFEAFLNGDRVAAGDDWSRVREFDVTSRLVFGKNVLAVKVTNEGGPAGLLVRALIDVRGGTQVNVLSDATWKASANAPDGWTSLAFDDAAWPPARSLGEAGAAPWGALAFESGFLDRFTVPPGFRVERVASPDDTGSIVAIAEGETPGTLLASRENGPVLRVDTATGAVSVFSATVKNCQGLLAFRGAVFAIGDGPEGTGLYRFSGGDCRCVARFKGGMGEHGPHAIVPGPDGALYVAVGNHASLDGEFDAASPYAGAYEGDLLLPRYEDANGHAAGILAPGGFVMRVDPDAMTFSLFAGGFRNHYDIAFDGDGELFTFDSDMEWDVGAPWYRPVRIVHVVPGGEYGWRSGFAYWPDHYLDSLGTVVDPGRGSPTGVTFYSHHAFPPPWRDAFFASDWAQGKILAIHLEPAGASYRGRAETFASGTPLNVTDLVAGPDGALYVSCGGRNTQGGIYRIVHDVPAAPREKGPRPASAEREKRRECEAIVREGRAADPGSLLPLLSSPDRFLRFAARLALERQDVPLWRSAALAATEPRLATAALLALLRKEPAAAAEIAARAEALVALEGLSADERLDAIRLLQLAVLKTGNASPGTRALLVRRFAETTDPREARDLARILAFLKEPAAAGAFAERLRRETDRLERIHVALCARYLPGESFTPADRDALLDFYEEARRYEGGHSFSGDIENIARDFILGLGDGGAALVLASGERRPGMARLVAEGLTAAEAARRVPDLVALDARLDAADPHAARLGDAIVAALGKAGTDEADARLAALFDSSPDRRLAIARAMAASPRPAHKERLLRTLEFAPKDAALEALRALRKLPAPAGSAPLPPAATRSIIVAGLRSGADGEKEAAALLESIHGRTPDEAVDGGAKGGPLAVWQAWFAAAHPEEPPATLPKSASPSPFTYEQLAQYITSHPEGKQGDAARGAAAYEKARCAQCHKKGALGAGLGPDLTTVRSRFQRTEILEAIVFPSHVISDQYRSAVVTTRDERLVVGLAAPRGADATVVLLTDGTETVIPNADIRERGVSNVSVMPEGLLDGLTLREIADLFAFLESR